MRKEVRVVNEETKTVQITTADERWYGRPMEKKINGVPVVDYHWLPSITWITGCLPKGKHYEEWLKENGKNADEILRDAGERGTKVHNAIEQLLHGVEVRMDSRYDSDNQFILEEDHGSTLHYTEMNGEEWNAVLTWVAWWEQRTAGMKVELIGVERSIYYYDSATKIGFGCTADLEVYLDGVYHVFDWKTSKSVYDSHRAQLSGIALAISKEHEKPLIPKLAIVQVGYTKNKNGYKETVTSYSWDDFRLAYGCWKKLFPSTRPTQRDLPVSAKIAI